MKTKKKSDQDEKELFKRLKKGSEDAKSRVLERYSPWVVNIARKFHSLFQNISLDELIAEGNRGILDALKRYDPSRKVRFSTYAWFWILKNIKEYITSELAVVDLPQSALSDLRKINETLNEEAKKGKSPTLETIARKLKMNMNEVREIISDKMNLVNIASLDKFVDEDDSGQRLGDMLEDKREKRIHETLDIRDDKIQIGRLLKTLSPTERKVIQLRFGFTENGSRSLKEVGHKLKLSSTKVRDIEEVSMRKLKKLLADRSERWAGR